MTEQTKQPTAAEQAWDKYQELCKEVTDVCGVKDAFIQAVEAVFLPAKGTEPKNWKPTFESADPDSRDRLHKIYEIMEKDLVVDVLGSIAECVYSVQAGMFNPEDLPPNSVELQLMVFNIVAKTRVRNAISAAMAAREQ